MQISVPHNSVQYRVVMSCFHRMAYAGKNLSFEDNPYHCLVTFRLLMDRDYVMYRKKRRSYRSK
jgi:hypothetical protein